MLVLLFFFLCIAMGLVGRENGKKYVLQHLYGNFSSFLKIS